MQVVLATGNPGKLAEMQALLAPLSMTALPQSQFTSDTVAETGLSFVENAILKARHAAQVSGLPAIADDSGIEVDALHGAPGIYSARYAGPQATDSQRITKLIDELNEVPDKDRTARFVCVLALVGPNQLEKTFTGVCEGRITQYPAGDEGFGFDPVFEYPPLGKTFAQMNREEKSAVSHRGLRFHRVRWLAAPRGWLAGRSSRPLR